MKKKQIAIVTRRMITGGVERALLAMLKQFDYDSVDIDLYLESMTGELLTEVPKEVRCLELPTVHASDAWKHPVFAVRKMWNMHVLKTKKLPYIEQSERYSRMLLPIRKKYDVAISYHAPNTVPVFYVMDQIDADRKILWLHGDLDTNAGDTPLAIQYHSRYDRVFGVSQSVLDSFLKYHPDMRDKSELFYNYVDADGIRAKAETGPRFEDDFSGMRILSIGRLDRQKGFDMAIEVCRALREAGYAIRWYVCGDGAQRRELENLIAAYRLQDTFVLLGNQTNPYGYLKACDLYVQPSRFEGYCTTTNEARMLCKPVITTAVSGATEQFEHGVTGWVVPISAQEILEQLKWCLSHPHEVERVSKRLETIEFQNKTCISRIYE